MGGSLARVIEGGIGGLGRPKVLLLYGCPPWSAAFLSRFVAPSVVVLSQERRRDGRH